MKWATTKTFSRCCCIGSAAVPRTNHATKRLDCLRRVLVAPDNDAVPTDDGECRDVSFIVPTLSRGKLESAGLRDRNCREAHPPIQAHHATPGKQRKKPNKKARRFPAGPDPYQGL
jgi:hypothetical protein